MYSESPEGPAVSVKRARHVRKQQILAMPAIMPESAGATRPVTMRISVGSASPCPKPMTNSAAASGTDASGIPIGVASINHARPTSPTISSPMPNGLT